MAQLRKVYEKVSEIFRREEKQKWPNPRDCIGDPTDYIKDKRGIVQLTCWDATGRAAILWETLGGEIREYMSNYADRPGVRLSRELIYEFKMFGPTEDTAVPTVLFRSPDKRSRRLALKAMKKSKIMNKYPLVEMVALGPSSGVIVLVAEDGEGDYDPLGQFYSENLHLVHASPSGPPVGRRLFITGSNDDDSPRLATGGPLLRIGGRYFQLTAGHVFHEMVASDQPTTSFEAPRMEDLDFDGLSDSEDEDEGSPDFTRPLTISLRGSTSAPKSINPTQQNATTASRAPTTERNTRNAACSRAFARSVAIGRPFKLPGASDLDYALVELDPPHRDDFNRGFNRIPSRPQTEGHWLYITGSGHIRKRTKHLIKSMASFDIPKSYTSVVVLTASSGLLKGKLCSTSSYLRLSDDKELHEVFPLRLEGTVAKGDCGSPVVDRVYGNFLGHIVAGAVGTGLAYIISASVVIENIEKRLHGTVEFSPRTQNPLHPEATKSRWRPLQQLQKGYKATRNPIPIRYDLGAPSQAIEFGSKRFLNDMEVGNAVDCVVPTKTAQWNQKPWEIALLSDRVCGSTSSKVFSQASRGNLPPQTVHQNTSIFQTHFYGLPLELQREIFGYFEVMDILNFRLVSRSWNNFVTSQESEIASSYLAKPHIPTLAIQLFPPTSHTTDFRYITRLWKRYSTACGLAALISDWIITDMFLQKKPEHRTQFRDQESRMRWRIVPLLLVIMHFFETYRSHRLDLSTTDSDHTMLEKEIMSEYDDGTLLHAHQFFRILMTFQARKLRPPAYFSSVERSLRGYLSEPPPENVQIAMLYLGGLHQLLRITQIKSYEKLRRAVDDWYENATQQATLVQDVAAVESTDMSTKKQDRKGKGRLVPPTSLETKGPMASLPVQEAKDILHKLPVSKSQIWVSTAESLLIERDVIGKIQDLKGDAGILQELVSREVLWADLAFFRRGKNGELDIGAEVAGLTRWFGILTGR